MSFKPKSTPFKNPHDLSFEEIAADIESRDNVIEKKEQGYSIGFEDFDFDQDTDMESDIDEDAAVLPVSKSPKKSFQAETNHVYLSEAKNNKPPKKFVFDPQNMPSDEFPSGFVENLDDGKIYYPQNILEGLSTEDEDEEEDEVLERPTTSKQALAKINKKKTLEDNLPKAKNQYFNPTPNSEFGEEYDEFNPAPVSEIPLVSEVLSNLNLDSDDEIGEIQATDIEHILTKGTTTKASATTKPKKSVLEKGLAYSKKKDLGLNFNNLKLNLKLKETTQSKVYSFQDQETFLKNLRFPTWAALSKKTDLSNVLHPTIIITDDSSSELKIRQDLISDFWKTKDLNSALVVNINPYTAFMKLFLDLSNNTLSFGILESLLGLLLTSEKIIVSSKYTSSDYVLYLLVNKLKLGEKLFFASSDFEINNIDMNFSDMVKEEMKNVVINTETLCNFLKLNKQPTTMVEKLFLEIFKIFNFKSQIKNEAFDGLTKTMLRVIREKELVQGSFNFLTLVSDLSEEYPMVPEKDIFAHYTYILDNFNRDGQIPLFVYTDTKITKRTYVNLDQTTYKKILSLTIIVQKAYGEFWTCMIPVQLFYARDFYSLSLEKILKYFTENKVNRLIMDADGKFYRHVQKKGIIMGKSLCQLELTGLEGNILKTFDPTMTKEEFILRLSDGGVPYVIKNDNIVIKDLKKASRFLKFQIDKNNSIFDFKEIIVMGKNNPKDLHYNNVLQYYNQYLQFNFKLFKCYLLQLLIAKQTDENVIKELKEYYKRDTRTTAPLNPFCYPSSYDLDEPNKVFITDFFGDFLKEFREVDEVYAYIDTIPTFIIQKVHTFYKQFLPN